MSYKIIGGIYDILPNEGSDKGNEIRAILGDFSYISDKNIRIRFGD